MNNKISIITLCYNQLETATKPFMESLYKYTDSKLFELIVINNGSTDGSLEFLENLKSTKKNITIINNTQNEGYSKGVNQGLKVANGDYFFILNNDVMFTPDWLNNMVKILKENNDIGILSPMTNYCFVDKQLIHDAKEITSNNYEMLYAQYLDSQNEFEYNDKVIFFCWAMRREVFKQVGYLDEKFGLAWFEDDDYSLRTLYQGYKVAIAKKVFVFHNHSQTTKELDKTDFGKELAKKNEKYFNDKHYFYINQKKELCELKRQINKSKKRINILKIVLILLIILLVFQMVYLLYFLNFSY